MEQKFKGKPGDPIEIDVGVYRHWAVIGGGLSSGLLANYGIRVMKFEKLADDYLVNNLKDKECKPESRQFKGEPGDPIEIDVGLYKHWAVIGGSGQLSGLLPNLGFRMVKLEKITDVVGSDHCLVNNLKDKECKAREPSVIVKEIREMVGRELQNNVVNKNCEHFATEKRYGKAESQQVQKAAWNAGLISAALGVVAGPPGVAIGFTAACAAALLGGLSSR